MLHLTRTYVCCFEQKKYYEIVGNDEYTQLVENSLGKITERLYPSHRKGTFGRENERFENGCVPFQDMEGGMDVMNVVVRETRPPCKATDLELLGLVEVYSPALML